MIFCVEDDRNIRELLVYTLSTTGYQAQGFSSGKELFQELKNNRPELILLDIILEEDCSCCKEIYYKASQKDNRIGSATVYRMINTLEEIGAISRKNMYKVDCSPECRKENACTIELEDNTVIELNEEKWNQIIRTGLAACGYAADGQKVRSITARSRTRECVEA